MIGLVGEEIGNLRHFLGLEDAGFVGVDVGVVAGVLGG